MSDPGLIRRVAAAALCSCLAAVACGRHAPVGAATGRSVPDRVVDLHGNPLAIHLVAGSTHASGPLLLYATGDGGWDSDRALFDEMRPWGYPLAGFSAADYVAHLGADDTIDPSALSEDYAAIASAARQALGLSDRARLVLVGFSRGSGLDVAAAAGARLRDHLDGVLAVALTGEEEYVVDEPAPGGPSARGAMFRTYEALPGLGGIKIAVIQSTRDPYLPADEARHRFGPDTPVRQFHAIDAAGHTFSDKLPELYAEMRRDLDWIVDER